MSAYIFWAVRHGDDSVTDIIANKQESHEGAARWCQSAPASHASLASDLGGSVVGLNAVNGDHPYAYNDVTEEADGS